MNAIASRIRAVFTNCGARAFVHARELDGAEEVSLNADEPVVLASVFKIPVALAYVRASHAGSLDPRERTVVTAPDRTGGIGIGGCADDAELTWRDLAHLMLTMSDNAATDALLRRVGLDAVRSALDSLGLTRTRITGGCADLFRDVRAELDLAGEPDIEAALAEFTDVNRVWALAVLDPARTYASTPREITTLLAAIWRDQAAPPPACAELRSIMAHQIWPHRLAAGFPDGVTVAGKTGTILAVRNEVGVVRLVDGREYAVAVFTRAGSLDERLPAVDAAIGTAARLAVESLSGGPIRSAQPRLSVA